MRRAKVAGLTLSSLVLLKPVDVAVLHGAGLTAIGQDAWLSGCGPDGYGLTREWAHALRRWAPDAAGLRWRARLDNDRLAYMFFGDRCPPDVFAVRSSYPIDPSKPSIGRRLVTIALREHDVTFW